MNYEQCSLCGMCRRACPVYDVTLKETDTPRAKSIMKKEGKLDIVSYRCTLCGACSVECPADIDLELLEERKKLVKSGIELESNKKMIKNVRKYGNPFGNPKDKKDPKELYCC